MNFKTLIALALVLAISTLGSAKQATFLSTKAATDSFTKVNDGELVHND